MMANTVFGNTVIWFLVRPVFSVMSVRKYPSVLYWSVVLGYLKGLDHASAAKYLSFYWGGAMVGRFLGSAIMAKIAPNRYLAFNATAAVALLGVAMLAGKPVRILQCGHCWLSASSTPSCSQPFSLWQPKVWSIYQQRFRRIVHCDCRRCGCACGTRLGSGYLRSDDFLRCISDLLCLYRLLCYKRLQS